jgi:hypothetical protein
MRAFREFQWQLPMPNCAVFEVARHGSQPWRMDDAGFDRAMARVLQVSPVEMTFEDGMRIVEFLTSFVVMFRQAENEQPGPDPVRLAKLDEEIEELIQARAALVTVWRRMVNECQPTLREYHAFTRRQYGESPVAWPLSGRGEEVEKQGSPDGFSRPGAAQCRS